ncbi:MAG: hypothetical protein IJ856_01125 [Candidatus Methanomethylophilaceae archaeon]|nr:hypothetical protein [Candidatus Methanomethylophilaceae archaeon]
MASGKKKRVMIACVTFETAKVVNPVMFYEVNKVHIIHYIRDPLAESSKIYLSFYDRVVDVIRERSPLDIEIVEHIEKVSDFSAMLRTVLKIIQDERAEDDGSEVYVNISSGSSEYAAASAIASMMVPGTIPFSVGTKQYTVATEDIPKVYFENGLPVGLTKDTYDPKTIHSYSIAIPDEVLVRGLRVLEERNRDGLQVTGPKMIESLKEKGIWYRKTEVSDPEKKARQRLTEAVYYQRDFVDNWSANGWVAKNSRTGKYEVTEEGRAVLGIFYT